MNASQHHKDVIERSRLISHKLCENSGYELTEEEVVCVCYLKTFLEAGLLGHRYQIYEATITLFEIAFLIGYLDKRQEAGVLKSS